MLLIHSHSESVVRGRKKMRGHVDPQSGLFSYFSVEERIPADHPLRRIKAQADSVLASMNAAFDAINVCLGGPAFDRPGALAQGEPAHCAVLGALGAAGLRDAGLQHAVPVVLGHEYRGALV